MEGDCNSRLILRDESSQGTVRFIPRQVSIHRVVCPRLLATVDPTSGIENPEKMCRLPGIEVIPSPEFDFGYGRMLEFHHDTVIQDVGPVFLDFS